MRRKRSAFKRRLALAGVCLLLAALVFQASAAVFVPYSTYTYDWNGEYMTGPHAYVPVNRITGADIGVGALNEPSALFRAHDGRFYIADTGNNRVLVLNSDMKVVQEINSLLDESLIMPYLEKLKEDGQIPEEYHDDLMRYYEEHLMLTAEDPAAKPLSGPEGVFVTKDNRLFIADTGNQRVVELRPDESYPETYSSIVFRSIHSIKADVLPEDFVFQPWNMVMDDAGRLYVNVKNVNSGIMEFSPEGEFVGFYGAQKVKQSVVDWFLSLFMTEAQREKQVNIVPRVYNNIAIDDDNFIWLTANSQDSYDRMNAVYTGDSAISSIKRLNPKGDDVLMRNAVNGWAPGGDVVTDPQDASSIVSVAIKSNGLYTLVDQARNKLFTYDTNGNLLYAFGGTGSQLGVFQLIVDATYDGDDLLVLDKSTNSITRFTPTAYAVAIEEALEADKNQQFERSVECWREVNKKNANFDQAYVGIAKSYYREKQYEKAMEYYKMARDTVGYSKAFKMYRSQFVRDNIILVLAVPTVLLVGVYFLNKYIKKVNARLHVTGEKTTLQQEVFYAFRAMYHPINGFWEIKREKRGTMRGALVILALATLAYCFKATGTAYLFATQDIQYVNLFQEAANVIIPVVLWTLASWSLTTLMSGEGSMKDIFIATCYALIPMVVVLIPTTLLSNVLSLDEKAFLTFFVSLAYVWTGILIVFGSMVIQDYTFSKNLLTVVLSVVGMGVIMFLVLLLISLTQKIGGFFTDLYREIAFRL